MCMHLIQYVVILRSGHFNVRPTTVVNIIHTGERKDFVKDVAYETKMIHA